MKKTLIFGTGEAASSFMRIDKNRAYIAAVDNDTTKYNKKFNGLLIISPNEIKDYVFDEIIVASYWESSIKRQLLDLGVIKEKISTPPKRMLKDDIAPFQDIATLQFAKSIIKKLCGKAYEQGIPLHLDFGTLIGVMRDNDLIPWDDDVDLAIEESYQKEIEGFLLNQDFYTDKELKWKLVKYVDKNDTVMDYLLYFKSKRYQEFSISISLKAIDNDLVIKKSSLGQWANPAHCIKKLDTIIWENTTMYIPSSHDTYLTYMYGNWKVPKKDVSLGEEYTSNYRHIPYEVFAEAKLRMVTIFEQK